MLRLFARNFSIVCNTFIPRSSHVFLGNISPGEADNEQLKASKFFSVSHVTTLVTSGGTGIGLMIMQALVANGAKVYLTFHRAEVPKQTDQKYDPRSG